MVHSTTVISIYGIHSRRETCWNMHIYIHLNHGSGKCKKKLGPYLIQINVVFIYFEAKKMSKLAKEIFRFPDLNSIHSQRIHYFNNRYVKKIPVIFWVCQYIRNVSRLKFLWQNSADLKKILNNFLSRLFFIIIISYDQKSLKYNEFM